MGGSEKAQNYTDVLYGWSLTSFFRLQIRYCIMNSSISFCTQTRFLYNPATYYSIYIVCSNNQVGSSPELVVGAKERWIPRDCPSWLGKPRVRSVSCAAISRLTFRLAPRHWLCRVRYCRTGHSYLTGF